ncbi:MAG: replicative DNA helicase [Cyanothece sp. SIO1E1]|nr:replicative DNA helicase [Cyanothece sp. SIO1E1]
MELNDPIENLKDKKTEEAVLGTLLMGTPFIDDVMTVITDSEVFYDNTNKQVFEAIKKTHSEGNKIDILSINEKLIKDTRDLRNRAKNGIMLAGLMQKVISDSSLVGWSKNLLELYRKRRVLDIGLQMQAYSKSFDYNAVDVLEGARKILDSIDSDSNTNSTIQVGDSVSGALDEVIAAKEKYEKGELSGIGCGLTDIDRMTGGWQDTDLIIVAGRPGAGKTAFMLNIVRSAALQFEKKIGVFSLEMSHTQLSKRLIALETGIEMTSMVRGSVSDEDISKIVRDTSGLTSSPIYLDDTAAITSATFRSRAHRMKRKYDVDMIVGDYLQLMRADTRDDVQRITELAETGKQVAKELDIPVIWLSQLNREVDKRNDKRPLMSDLRGSGGIEQAADAIIMLYRPEYYDIEKDENGNPLEGKMEVIFRKHRNGPEGSIWADFDKRTMKISNNYN